MGSFVARLNPPILPGSIDSRHLPARRWKCFLDGMEMISMCPFLRWTPLVLVMSADILEFAVMRTTLGPLLDLVMTQLFPFVSEQLPFVGRLMTPRCERTSVDGAETPLTVNVYVVAALRVLVGWSMSTDGRLVRPRSPLTSSTRVLRLIGLRAGLLLFIWNVLRA